MCLRSENSIRYCLQNSSWWRL